VPPGPHILLVDDEPDFLNSMVRLLHHTPCRLYTAAGTEEALTIAQNTPLDLLITDYLMPGRDGLELIFAVNRQSPQTGLVLLTAVEKIARARAEIEEMATFDLHFKPLDRDTLMEIFRKYCPGILALD
jgi:DNA-binding NtrC family response regulator